MMFLRRAQAMRWLLLVWAVRAEDEGCRMLQRHPSELEQPAFGLKSSILKSNDPIFLAVASLGLCLFQVPDRWKP